MAFDFLEKDMNTAHTDPEFDYEDNRISMVSSAVAKEAYNRICLLIKSEMKEKYPDCFLEQNAKFVHEFFVKLF